MAIPTLPDQSDANIAAAAAQAAAITAGNAAFIQSTTILIENAIANGLFTVFPSLGINVDYTVVSAYFTNLDYVVSVPPYPGFGWPPIYPAPGWDGSFCDFGGFQNSGPPPAYPSPGWAAWQNYVQSHPFKIQISWGPAPT